MREGFFELTGKRYKGSLQNVSFQMEYIESSEYVMFEIQMTNLGQKDFEPKDMGISLGIDTYMGEYPKRNQVFFPTMLRCEKTHFYGYLMNPEGKIYAIASPDPIASYTLHYCHIGEEERKTEEYGHRIRTVSLSFLHCGPLPQRHPDKSTILKGGETKDYRIYFIPVESLWQCAEKISRICHIPVITAEQYTLSLGSRISFHVAANEKYEAECYAPGGRKLHTPIMEEYGLYTVRIKTENKKIAEAKFYCRKPWSWYLEQARKEAIEKPQKASTHTESWYGFFSAFLAAKHAPDSELDEKVENHFHEIMPLMFDMKQVKPLVIPERIQNTAAFISLLVDKYEMNPEKNFSDLKVAAAFADWLMSRQKKEGGYYNGEILYTCVIYIAKSVLELAAAEKSAGLEEAYQRHYASAAKAIDQLKEKLDNIQTEGEQTFEDGMIICSALQLAMYALTLPEKEREAYVKAAVYMDKLHECLEQKLIPDCRMNGGSLRFWEGQYDIMCMKNFIQSPHGWSAWSAYAKYYLYLLTGREQYLKELFNTLGSCVQLMSLDGELRWAFAADPYVEAKRLLPDYDKPIKDGYSAALPQTQAYRGRFENVVFGEEYLDMISGWYRIGKEKITGGYLSCPLIMPDEWKSVDNQGGACDNDVHEIFKCMEECVLKKAFVVETEGGEIRGYNCTVSTSHEIIEIELYEETEWLHTNLQKKHTIKIQNEVWIEGEGMNMVRLKN